VPELQTDAPGLRRKDCRVGLKPWGLVRLFGELFVAGRLACRQRKCVTGASSASLQHIHITNKAAEVTWLFHQKQSVEIRPPQSKKFT
jgi:hypothetical protein